MFLTAFHHDKFDVFNIFFINFTYCTRDNPTLNAQETTVHISPDEHTVVISAGFAGEMPGLALHVVLSMSITKNWKTNNVLA